MELPKLEYADIHYLNTWFSNIVDAINYDLAQIEDAVPALSMMLTTLDTAPIQYLAASLNKIVDNINDGFSKIDSRLNQIESDIKVLQGGG